MIVSLLYKVTRTLLSAASVLLRGKAGKDAELLGLRHENTVLRRQLASPIRYRLVLVGEIQSEGHDRQYDCDDQQRGVRSASGQYGSESSTSN